MLVHHFVVPTAFSYGPLLLLQGPKIILFHFKEDETPVTSGRKMPTLRQIYMDNSMTIPEVTSQQQTSQFESLDAIHANHLLMSDPITPPNLIKKQNNVTADNLFEARDNNVAGKTTTTTTTTNEMASASTLTTVFNFEVTPPPDTSQTLLPEIESHVAVLPDVVPKSYRRRLRHHRGSLTHQPSRLAVATSFLFRFNIPLAGSEPPNESAKIAFYQIADIGKKKRKGLIPSLVPHKNMGDT